MAVEQFTWLVEREVDPTIDYRVVEAQFGDGYAQTSSDGINNKSEEYAIRVHAKEADAKLIMAFFDRHKGTKSFIWQPPLGKLSLFTCKNPTPKAQGGGLYLITGTFKKAYASMADTAVNNG
jgi:phage-related protein